jgi:hypothetical protein
VLRMFYWLLQLDEMARRSYDTSQLRQRRFLCRNSSLENRRRNRRWNTVGRVNRSDQRATNERGSCVSVGDGAHRGRCRGIEASRVMRCELTRPTHVVLEEPAESFVADDLAGGRWWRAGAGEWSRLAEHDELVRARMPARGSGRDRHQWCA